MRVLLHSCCGPCTTFPLFFLRSLGYGVDGIFFNPNIYPDAEREKRRKVLEKWAKTVGYDVLYIDSSHDSWLEAISSAAASGKPARCARCYEFRLEEVARVARDRGYDWFTTTLLVSPYQDREALLRAARQASELYGVPHLAFDFRVGYKRSRELARASSMYMQKYCGCEFSAGGET